MLDRTAKTKRAKRVQQAASCLGIFYLVRSKLWIDATPLARAGAFGDFQIHERGHICYWQGLVSTRKVTETEYEEHPRGRVAYNTKSGKFLFLADRCILRRKAVVDAILRKLHLPKKRTEIKADSHYRCFPCLRGDSVSC